MFDAADDLNLEESVSAEKYLSWHDGRERGCAEAKMKALVDVLKGRAVRSSNECTWARFQRWENC